MKRMRMVTDNAQGRARGIQRKLTAAAMLAAMLCVAGATGAQINVPASPDAPKAGQKAPEFTLPDSAGKMVKLSDLLSEPMGGTQKPWVLLIFYRGYW